MIQILIMQSLDIIRSIPLVNIITRQKRTTIITEEAIHYIDCKGGCKSKYMLVSHKQKKLQKSIANGIKITYL